MEFTIVLKPEYFENYLFIGWETEEGEDYVLDSSILVTIDPKEVTDDLTFTAHYLQASYPANTEGLMTLISYGVFNYYARDVVEKIIVTDMRNKAMVTRVVVYYSGEQPPEVICREGVTVEYKHDPEEVEKQF